MDGAALTESDAPGLALLGEYGFLDTGFPDAEIGDTDPDDPTCLTELQQEIEKGETVLRLFLNDNKGDYFKRLRQSGEAEALINGSKTFEQILTQYWPSTFIISDACLTNAPFIWFNKHFYL